MDFLIAQNYPPYVNSLITIAISLILAIFLNILIKMLLKEVAFRTKTSVDDKIINSLEEPIFWTVLLTGIYFSLIPLDELHPTDTYLKKTFETLIAIIWGVAANKIVYILTHNIHIKSLEEGGNHKTFKPFIDNFSKVLISIGVLTSILIIWDVNIAPALAPAGILGVAFAFAAKDTLSNLIGGFSVYFDKPYKIGDYVIIKDLYRGEVTDIGMRSTRIRTRDNILITIPNAVMVTDAVINETGFDPKLRIRIKLGVSYDSDLNKVEKVIRKVLRNSPHIVNNSRAVIRYREFGEYSIVLEAMGMITEPENRGRIVHETIKDIHKAFKLEKIKIPYPQRDVHTYPHEIQKESEPKDKTEVTNTLIES